jgi:dTDP-4-amino-4,6-dideoxygalactose transaminase
MKADNPMVKFFERLSIDAFKLWPESLDTAVAFGYSRGDCPCFEDILGRILMLPCYAELTERQLQRLKEACKAMPMF